MIVAERIHEIARNEFHVIEFREIENMRFRQHGRGDIQLVTNLRQILKKTRIGQFLGIFVYELFTDSAVRQ